MEMKRPVFRTLRKCPSCAFWKSSRASEFFERCVACMKLPSADLVDSEFETSVILCKMWAWLILLSLPLAPVSSMPLIVGG